MKLWRPRDKTLAHLLLLLTVFTWGATFSLVKNALADASPLLFNLLRMAAATVVLVLFNRRHLGKISRPHLRSGVVAGIFLAAGYQLQTLGLARTTAVNSAFLTGLVVIFVPLLTLIPLLRPVGVARPGTAVLLGATLAFVGLFFLTSPEGSSLRDVTMGESQGNLLSLLCAIAFALHLLALAHFAKGVPTRQLATIQIAAATIFMLVTLPLSGRLYLHLTPRLFGALGITSILGTAAAFTVQSWAQSHLAPSHTAVILTLEPVFALLVAVLFLGEQLSRRALIGSALILIGIGGIEILTTAAVSPHPE